MATADQAVPRQSQLAARLAWSACGIALALLVLTLLLIVLGHSTPLPDGYLSWQDQAVQAVGVVGPAILGAVIVARRPTNPYGWLWCGLGLSLAVLALGASYAAYAAVDPGSLPAFEVVAMVGDLAWGAAVTLLVFILLLFPDGRLPSRRWRALAWAVAVGAAALLIAGVLGARVLGIAPIRNPLAVGGPLGKVLLAVAYTGGYVVIVGVVLAACSLVVRFRRGTRVERQQIKWFLYAAAWFGAFAVFSGLLDQQLPGLWHSVADTLTSAGLYLGVGIAILRYRLYDIDRLINRTLVYAVLTALLAGVYAGLVLVLGQVFGGLGGKPPSWAVAGATLAVAALFQPARRRIQQAVDRRFNRRRFDTAKIIEAFSAQLRNETDLDRLAAELLAVVNQTMQPTKASLWLRPPTSTSQDHGRHAPDVPQGRGEDTEGQGSRPLHRV